MCLLVSVPEKGQTGSWRRVNNCFILVLFLIVKSVKELKHLKQANDL